MSTPSQRKRLPIHPSLEHLQKQAKRLSKQNPALQLAAAQHQLAREYGCKNWAELAHMVTTMARRQDEEADLDKRFEAMPGAARAGDLEEVRRLLQDGAFTPHALDQTLAHLLWYGDEWTWIARKAAADLVLEQGADPDGQYGSGGYGPLVFGTAECLQPDGLEYLIAAGADVTALPIDTKYGPQCVMSHVLGTYIRGANARKHRCLDLLLEHGAFVPPEITPSILAIHRGDTMTLRTLLEKEPALRDQRFPAMTQGNISLRGATLLHAAAEFGEADCVRVLLQSRADVNATADVIDGVGGQTPLYHAIGCAIDGDSAALRTLLSGPPRTLGSLIGGKVGVLFGRPDPQADLSIRATCRRFGTVTPQPMTPFDFATFLGEKTDPARRGEVMATLKFLQLSRADGRQLHPMNDFTPRAQNVLALARKEAAGLHHDQVDSEHLLLGLLALGNGAAIDILRKVEVDLPLLRKAVEKAAGIGRTMNRAPAVPYTPRVKKILALAGKEALTLGHRSVGTIHLLLGLLREDEGVAGRELHSAGLDLNRIHAAIAAAEQAHAGWSVD